MYRPRVLLDLIVTALVLLALAAVTTARPSFAPLGGFDRLRAHSSAFLNEDGVHQDEFYIAWRRLAPTQMKTSKSAVIHLDEEMGLESVLCSQDMKMVLHFGSAATAEHLHRRILNQDALLTGGLEWRCVDQNNIPQVILRRVETVALGSNDRLILQTSPAEHKDYFDDLKLWFSTTKLPPPRTIRHSGGAETLGDQSVQQVEGRHKPSSRSIGSFLGRVWSAIKKLGQDIEKLVQTEVEVVKILETGSLSVDESYKLHYAKWGSEGTTLNLDNGLVCANCTGKIDVGVHFSLDIVDNGLNEMTLVAEGNVDFNIGATLAISKSYQKSGSCRLYTVRWDPIVFTVGGIPFVLTMSVPIDEEWNIQAEAAASISSSIQTQGSIRYGVQYKNGQRIPINWHTYHHHGKLPEVDVDVKVDLTFGLKIVPVVFVDLIGFIDFSINPFAELSLDYNLNTGCNGYGGLRTVVNWGLSATVGWGIKIPSLNFLWNMSSLALCNIKKPVYSCCVQWPPMSDGGDSRRTAVEAYSSAPLMVGNTWHGWQIASLNCKSDIQYYDANVTFQLIDYTQGGMLFTFVVSYSYVMPDNSWCVQQALYDGTIYYGGNVILTPTVANEPDPVFYSKCQNPDYEQQILSTLDNSITGTVSDNNWDQILVESSDLCVTVSVSRVNE